MPLAAAVALRPASALSGDLPGAWCGPGIGEASGGRAGARSELEAAGAAGDVDSQAASAPPVEGVTSRSTDAGGSTNARDPPGCRSRSPLPIASRPPWATGAATEVALTGATEASLGSGAAAAGVISLVSTGVGAARTGPAAAETTPSDVSSGGGRLTGAGGNGGNGASRTGAGRGIEMPAPTFTGVTGPSSPGLANRIAILALIC